MSDKPTISVSERTWKRINRKRDSGDTFEDIVAEALDALEEQTDDRQAMTNQ